MGYQIVDVDLARPLPAVRLAPHQSGVGLLARWRGRPVGFAMLPAAPGSVLEADAMERIAGQRFALELLRVRTGEALAARRPAPPVPAPVSLSVAICTKDRAQRLRRLLASLDAVRAGSRFERLEILVVDNASVDASTREAAAAFPGVRYVHESCTGLDFARNAALRAATGRLVAYLDDDVVVDRHWLDGLHAVWSDCPEAGGYTGLVLPYRLDTRAQVAFEHFGGFGRGFVRLHHRAAKYGARMFPVGAGEVGAGCNMAFDRELLLRLGGFDEALDTGAPLPGGGDLDIFYRVLRSGRAIVYEPRYAVFHEHRETLAQLRRQYWTWGLGFMAFLVKCRRTDAALRDKQRDMLRWWFDHQLRRVLRAVRHGQLQHTLFALAELRGGVRGLLGEYDRSQRRSQAIRERTA